MVQQTSEILRELDIDVLNAEKTNKCNYNLVAEGNRLRHHAPTNLNANQTFLELGKW